MVPKFLYCKIISNYTIKMEKQSKADSETITWLIKNRAYLNYYIISSKNINEVYPATDNTT